MLVDDHSSPSDQEKNTTTDQEEQPQQPLVIKKIACIGAGYVGGPTMSVIATKCHDIQVIIYDMNQQRIDAWNSAELPIFEPGLEEIVMERRGKNLHFTTDYQQVVDSDVIFLSVNTPTKYYGVGKGRAADLKYVESCARQLRDTIKSGRKIIVEKSTVPTRTSIAVKRILESGESKARFDILSNPEFLAEGTAISDLQNPDRVLIGGEDEESIRALSSVYERWVPKERVITTNLWSSELSKLVANCMLAQRISSMNAISALCEKTGADIQQVSFAVGKDTRIGSKFLQASVGFGGSCFQKDILNLVYLADHYNLPEVAKYFYGIIEINNFQRERFAKKVIHKLFNTVSGKKICVLGFAFKKDTSDTRETSSIFVCKSLLEERAKIHIYDPKVTKKQIMYDMKSIMNDCYDGDFSAKMESSRESELVESNIFVSTDPYEAMSDAHAILVLTEWDEFKQYDYKRVFEGMKKPAYLFDGRNILNRKDLETIGFDVYQIGKQESHMADW
ncbi:predicted protein [Naegleria gruberi]|uniref:UDP-glucose 6-dehydrogenase n=1 Tax=Naegleria gruberi TaxID=5762 RepID=D2UZ10_NAEGR|nr:uncharacterized protein NAEGRDRAFT_61772 [Naegleria gruberi]EFC49865.1 predicted protein [Naegleria gruberi]|eukprot:XP_002682609.1 predicted protein [Naegleria gruberi strain NEG-M]